VDSRTVAQSVPGPRGGLGYPPLQRGDDWQSSTRKDTDDKCSDVGGKVGEPGGHPCVTKTALAAWRKTEAKKQVEQKKKKEQSL